MARWLTLAIRLMCLWTRGAYPPELQDKLRHAVKYIVQVYAVSWLEIKRESKFHNQQLYIFTMIQRMKQQAEEIQSIAFKNLKYNAFALLPENELYFILKSDDLEVRKTAHKKILLVRYEQPAKEKLKKIIAINTEATHWSQLISLSESGICEPALTEDFSDLELQDALLNDTKFDLPELPSHSQTVERAVKLTSEASHSVYGLASRHSTYLSQP